MVVLVRPEQLVLSAETFGDLPTGRVLGTEFYGHDAVVRVLAEGNEPHTLVVRTSDAGTLPGEGARVSISVRGSVIAWIEPSSPSEIASDATMPTTNEG
jgi:hypothetical protein